MYYIYRHIRPDKNCPFYIGRGKLYERMIEPRRAYEVKRRNHLWQGIVDRNGGNYEVEILYWSANREHILEKEREFIALYGKIIDGTGTLCNLTDGGDGSLGLKHSEEVLARLSAQRKNDPKRLALLRSEEFKAARRAKMAGKPGPAFGSKHKPETIELYRRTRTGSLNHEAKQVIDNATGTVYGCVGDAATAYGIGRASLYKALSGQRQNRTTLRYVNGL